MDELNAAKIQEAIDAVCGGHTLTELKGLSKELDMQFGLVGPEHIGAILRESLPGIFQQNPGLVRETLTIVGRSSQKQLADFIGGLFRGHEELRREVSHVLWMASQSGAAKAIRSGERSFWHDTAVEHVLVNEYASVDAAILRKLECKLWQPRLGIAANNRLMLSSTAESESGDRSTATRAEPQPGGSVIALAAGLRLNMLAWDEMQQAAQAIEPAMLGPEWQKEPRRSLLWLLQNGVQEQLFVYLCNQAAEFDDHLRGLFLKALQSDKRGEIPLIWKNAIRSALLGSSANQQAPTLD